MERLQALTLFCQYKLDRLYESEPGSYQIDRVAHLFSTACDSRITTEHILTLMDLMPDLKRKIADLRPADLDSVSELSSLCDQLDIFLFGVPRPALVYNFSPDQHQELRRDMWRMLKFPTRPKAS